jgi:hypothetical protein
MFKPGSYDQSGRPPPRTDPLQFIVNMSSGLAVEFLDGAA